MRTAAIVFAAVLTALAVCARAYGNEPDGFAAAGAPGIKPATPPAGAPMIIAEGGSGGAVDSLAAERLGGTMPATGTTAEIPPAQTQPDPLDPSAIPVDPSATSGEPQAVPSQGPQQSAGEQEQSLDPEFPDDSAQSEVPPHVYSLQDFVNQGLDDSPIGMELREDCTRLADREKVCGLAVLDVRRGSPAAKAGIQRYRALTHDLLDGASVAAALVFPPAIVAVAVIDQSGIGESFDLVIGVDGRRVRHILDFQDLTANLRAGDILYLTVVRAGKRLQIPVKVPRDGVSYRN
jgi:PDZ domain